MSRRTASSSLLFDVGEQAADEARVELGPVAFVDGDFGRAEEVRGALDLTDDGFSEPGLDVAGVFGLKEL